MNLVVVSSHDWRECLREGFRHRSAHFIEHLLAHEHVDKVLMINRPITRAEMLLKRIDWKTPGEILFERKNSRLVQVHKKGYVLDYKVPQSLQHIALRRKWYFSAFEQEALATVIREACDYLGIAEFSCWTNHVFAAKLFTNITPQVCAFDLDDDWLKFPHYRNIQSDLYAAYRVYADRATFWTTNSEQNRRKFMQEFGVHDITVINNGVDKERFQRSYPVPEDLKPIPRPIIGFGGQINHLMNVNLLNEVMRQHKDKSFVVVGDILEPDVFNAIAKLPNFFYLGYKHYDEYPAYVTHFDVCIVSHFVGDRSYGNNLMKLYEYIAAGKPVVSTNGNGAENLQAYIEIAEDATQFSAAIDRCLSESTPHQDIPDEFTWRFKTDILVNLMEQAQHRG